MCFPTLILFLNEHRFILRCTTLYVSNQSVYMLQLSHAINPRQVYNTELNNLQSGIYGDESSSTPGKRKPETLAAELLLQTELCDQLRDDLENERRNLNEIQDKYSMVLTESQVKTLRYQADIQQLQEHQKGAVKIASPTKSPPQFSSSPSFSGLAKMPVRATASLPVSAGTAGISAASKMTHQASLDANALSVQTNIAEADESSSTSSGVRSPSFYGFRH